MTRKRIGWDLRCLPADGSPGAGIPHAARELWSACVRERSEDTDLIAFVSENACLDEGGMVIRLPSSRSRALRDAVRAHPIDLLFCPSGTVPFGLSVPAIPWIHDLAILKHPDWFPESWWQRMFTTQLVRRGICRAPDTLVVSEATKREVVTWTGLDPTRVIVTGQGIELPSQEGALPSSLQGKSYALMLGTVEPRKNSLFLQSIWSEVCHHLAEEIPLVIAGRQGWGKVVLQEASSLVRIPDVSEATRLALLRHASVVLVPSLYEGFGRVAAEALTLGIPVIASDRGALPEVIGEAGQCLPLDPDRWIKAIIDTIRPGPIRNYWVSQASTAINTFSWSPVAERVLANLKENC
jgi:glycosyltransferase involved in cell wall biosynthesis